MIKYQLLIFIGVISYAKDLIFVSTRMLRKYNLQYKNEIIKINKNLNLLKLLKYKK